ncbi:hypothetical protein I316_06277 [Kwoniella heveanensis BCC8398]|uniref:Amino acid permease/ SLC12A domain-containing protein n=1 Tax=Kwoniella heveanensis BCC8398 TaxID=1296120 RepID=A0A1B9GMB8_9TREE|nr:hypothetical protein I316_06277 [Kwoniella heveanensis BCC8398]
MSKSLSYELGPVPVSNDSTGKISGDSQTDKADANYDNVQAVEDGQVTNTSSGDLHEGLHQKLKARHLVFISLGSVIGTGIFLGIGNSLKHAGPVGLVLAYTVMCSVVICVMECVGEMVTYLPVVGAHIRLSGRFIDPAISAAMAWNYWYCWAIIVAAEVSAVAVLVTYWTEAVPSAVWITISLVIILAANLCGPRVYAEIEFYMATIKVTTIIGLIILSIIIDAGGGPNGKKTGFQYWRNPGPFVQYQGVSGSTGRFLAFFSGLTGAAFASIGAEMLAIAAAETTNPRRLIPTALKATWIRIVLFYFCGAFVVSLIVASNDPRLGSASTAAASPYVIAITEAGIKVLPSIINAAILTSALSAGIGDCYTACRALHSMAGNGTAPKIFGRTTRWGSPYVAVITTWALGLLAYLGVKSSSSNVFNFLVNLTALSGIITWLCIGVSFVRFRKGLRAQNMSPKDLPYTSHLGVAGAWWIIGVILAVLLFSGWPVFRKGNWDTATFFGNYLPIGLFTLIFLFFKFWRKTKFVRASEMDLVSGVEEFERQHRQAEDERQAAGIGSRPWYQRIIA